MICIQNLCKSFDDKVIFNDFNIDIADGEFVIFAGNSGCGKTTLLNMIGGIENPDKGTICVDGVNICLAKNKKDYFANKVGFLFQNFALLENKTVRQNLELVQKKTEQIIQFPKYWKQLVFLTKKTRRYINFPVVNSKELLLHD